MLPRRGGVLVFSWCLVFFFFFWGGGLGEALEFCLCCVKVGRAFGREKVEISGGAGSLKKKTMSAIVYNDFIYFQCVTTHDIMTAL